MKMTISKKLLESPPEPWAVTIFKLKTLEHEIVTNEVSQLEKRWLFGRELVSKRVELKGRQVIPADLMKLTMEQCKLGRTEINYRVQFAVKYPTKKEMSGASGQYPSWNQMVRKGLVEKKTPATKKTAAKDNVIQAKHTFKLRSMEKEVDKALTQHRVLNRDEVKMVERMIKKLNDLLARIDRNDVAKAEKAATS